MEILKIVNLSKKFVKKNIFNSTTSIVKAVDNVSFSIKKGEVFVLAGESGSGKSTIAKLILKSLEGDSGKIFFEDLEIKKDKSSVKRIQMNCQMIQQDPYDSINPRMRIGEIISEPLEIHKIGNLRERKKRVGEVLQEVKLEPVEEIIKKFPHMLSGGQRQRVVLARALVLNPKLIIADEPVSMLDVSIRAEIIQLMYNLQDRLGITFLYITHDLATARYFGNRIGILYRGKLVETGRINDVLLTPHHPYTKALIDALSEPDPENIKKIKNVKIIGNSQSEINSGCLFRGRCPYVIERCNIEPPLEERNNEHFVACHVLLD